MLDSSPGCEQQRGIRESPCVSDRVPGSCAWNARTRGTPCSRDFSPRHDKGNADGEKSRPTGRIEIVRSRRHDVTALQLSRFLPLLIWFEFEKVSQGRRGESRNGSWSEFFLILRDTWCLRRLGWDEKLKFLHCENFGRFRISWNFGDWTWVASSLRRGSSGIIWWLE